MCAVDPVADIGTHRELLVNVSLLWMFVHFLPVINALNSIYSPPKDHIWHHSDYPHPLHKHLECGMDMPLAYVCDPDNQFSKPFDLHRIINASAEFTKATPCPCNPASLCGRAKRRNGFWIGIAIVREIDVDIDKSGIFEKPEIEHFAERLLDSWRMGRCGNDILLFYSAKQNQFHPVFGEKAKKSLEIMSPHLLDSVTHMAKRNLVDAILIILDCYNWKLNGSSVVHSVLCYMQRTYSKIHKYFKYLATTCKTWISGHTNLPSQCVPFSHKVHTFVNLHRIHVLGVMVTLVVLLTMLLSCWYCFVSYRNRQHHYSAQRQQPYALCQSQSAENYNSRQNSTSSTPRNMCRQLSNNINSNASFADLERIVSTPTFQNSDETEVTSQNEFGSVALNHQHYAKSETLLNQHSTQAQVHNSVKRTCSSGLNANNRAMSRAGMGERKISNGPENRRSFMRRRKKFSEVTLDANMHDQMLKQMQQAESADTNSLPTTNHSRSPKVSRSMGMSRGKLSVPHRRPQSTCSSQEKVEQEPPSLPEDEEDIHFERHF